MNDNQMFRAFTILIFSSLLFSFFYATPARCEEKENPVVAVIDGVSIQENEVISSSQGQFDDLKKRHEREYQKEKHAMMEQLLNQMIDDRLVEAEAAARKVTKEEVLSAIQAATPTDADVDAFYNENQARIQQPKEQIAPQIKTYLQQQNMSKARNKFFDELREKHKVQFLLDPLRTEVAAVGPSRGPSEAPVTIVEFSDFQCPYCSRLTPTLDQVHQKYGDQVKIVFRQFPLAMHQNAQKAAEASLCANEQGKFWELHDQMFQNQQELAPDQLKAKAVKIGLNAEQFNGCLDSGKYAAAVATDMAAGNEAGVTGTPAMFVNGRFISGAVPLDTITAVVDDELKRKGMKTAPPTE